jgi:hypothetical protein
MTFGLTAAALFIAIAVTVFAWRALARLWALRKMVGELASEHSNEADSPPIARDGR